MDQRGSASFKAGVRVNEALLSTCFQSPIEDAPSQLTNIEQLETQISHKKYTRTKRTVKAWRIPPGLVFTRRSQALTWVLTAT